MSYALVTVVCPVARERIDTVRALIDELGNPAGDALRDAIESVTDDSRGLAVHFASVNVFLATAGNGHLVFEFSADGTEQSLLHALAKRAGHLLAPVFAHATDRGNARLEDYWASHTVTVGQGPFDNPGLVFAGTPGLSVGRIRNEGRLAEHVTGLVTSPAVKRNSALQQLDTVRKALANDEWKWALVPMDAEALHAEQSIGKAAPGIAVAGICAYLWPVAVPALVAFCVALAMDWSWKGFLGALLVALAAGIGTAIAAVAALLIAYAVFRRQESSERPEDRVPDPATVARCLARENHVAQNHLALLSVRKPGLLRSLTLRLAFFAIGQLASKLFRPGWLGTLGTIHFARWVVVPKTGDLLFLSNYGGSWESYLEDFITKAHNGLTAVWSNTVGFPKSSNLFLEGATDSARFKRWARRQQIPTGCWYSAYPSLTTENIRRNAAIRQGLGTVLTEEEALRWLALFGSQARPASAFEAQQVQSIIFGGLGFLRYGMCLGFRLRNDPAAAREWLRALLPRIAFGDGRKHRNGAIILSVAASSLDKLGLNKDAIGTFPPAFLDGMCAEWRSRILGDEGNSAPGNWKWGGPEQPVDGVLLLYTNSDAELVSLKSEMELMLTRYKHVVTIDIPFVELPRKNAPLNPKRTDVEPFGFVDGVSQPVIRGMYKALRGADPIHIVEAGEFVLGYPDNRGFLPAGPVLAAIFDPENTLPIAAVTQHGFAEPIVNVPRDIGRNGTFLAIRQLEQDVTAFNTYCAEAAEEIQNQFPEWIGVTGDFVAAKMVGRWKDGTSLVRYPYRSGTEDNADEHLMVRTAAGTAIEQAVAAPPPPPPLKHKPSGVNVAAEGAAPGTSEPGPMVKVAPDNDFLFGAEDPQGLRCPFGAHIRRANPRESFEPGSREQLTIANRHRIMRIGRMYQQGVADRNPGLFFMCLNADLERQFEFVQQTWVQDPSFHGLSCERDPLLGRPAADAHFTIPTREGPVMLRSLPEFVRMRGGGYFFVPGKALLEYLSSPVDQKLQATRDQSIRPCN